ncbi:MAG: preprotein translocase subunit SecG [Christensenellales bacterium]
MEVINLILRILLALSGIVVITVVAMQSGKNEGASAGIMGGGGSSDSYFGKNKGKTLEGRLVLLTKISVAALIVLSIATAIIQKVAA